MSRAETRAAMSAAHHVSPLDVKRQETWEAIHAEREKKAIRQAKKAPGSRARSPLDSRSGPSLSSPAMSVLIAPTGRWRNRGL